MIGNMFVSSIMVYLFRLILMWLSHQ